MAREFQVDLRGVVELLARHVYSSPRVFVRELLQNGVDAVTARRMQDPTAPLGPVLLQPADAGGAGALVVSDPGIGITIDEVHELLATVGASSKGAIDGEPTGFLGRFGVGLLSCFVIAERIEVVSRSASGAPPIRWTGQDDGTYEVQELSVDDPAAPSSPGTRVRLDPRPDMAEWVGAAMVELLAATFGAALRVPVLVERADGTQVQLSDPDPPWRTGSRVAAAQAWSERHLGFTPMAVLPISIPSLGIEGSAFVPPEEAHPTNRGGAHVYLSGMLLGEDVPDVVPEWAFFVRVVIDGDGLHPTASRESLVDDEALAAARHGIGEQVRAWMLALTQADPDLLTRITRVHLRAAKALAARDLVAFAELAPWLPFETSHGVLTLPDIVERSPAVRFTRTVDRFRQLAPIAVAQDVLLVNGGYSYDSDLLDRLVDAFPGASGVEVGDDEIIATFDDVPAERLPIARRFEQAAEAALAEVDCRVEVRAYDPEAVATLLLLDPDGATSRTVRATEDEVTDPLWADLLASLDQGHDARARLICNDRNPLVRALQDQVAAGQQAAALAGTAVRALYVQALLLGRHPLRGADLAMLTDALQDLVSRAMGADGGTDG